jgi:glucokinase
MHRLAIGIDIGGTNTKAGLVDLEEGEVLETLISPTEKRDPDRFLEATGEMVESLQKKAREESAVSAGDSSELVGIGIGIPGFVLSSGVVDSTYGFLDFMEDYPLVALVEEKCSLPCRADNDARVVALGEALYGVGKGYDRVLVLTLGTGLGVGFVAGGRFESPLPYDHMGGHICIDPKGATCYCGKKGCLESLVSATGIVEAARRLDWQQKYPELLLDVATIFRAEQEGNPDAYVIVNNFLEQLKTGIDNYINLFAPDMIIIGGGVSKGMGPYLERLSDIESLKPYKSYSFRIALSSLAERSGILGSAALLRVE